MKMTMTDGTVFEGSMAEYAELLAFAKAQQAEELKVGTSETDDAEPAFKVGDYIVGLGSHYNITNANMTLGKVVGGTILGGDDIRIEVLAHRRKIEIGFNCSVQSKYFRKATAEEIAQYEKALADASTPKHMRKTRKFKAGDIVRSLGTCNGHRKGVIGTVVLADGTNRPKVLANGNVYWTNVELVAPVESLV